MTLIDKDALLKYPIRINRYDKENGNEHFALGIESMIEFAESLPTIEAAEVVHAEWIVKSEPARYFSGEIKSFYCSECGKESYPQSPYCPNCGAKMDGHKKEGL